MPEEMIPFVLFAVRLPGYSGWMPEYIEAQFEEAAEAITKKYPDALEFRIITRGSCKKAVFSNKLEEMSGSWRLFDFGWYYDALEARWLAPDEEANRPTTPVLPAAVSMHAEPPEYGWWCLHLKFSPSLGSESSLWQKYRLSQEAIQCDIRCSDVFDPVGNITTFVDKIKSGKDARVMIDEEGCFVCMLAWCPAQDSLCLRLRVESLLYAEDYCHDFQLERAQFVVEFEKILEKFRDNGGWGERYSDFEDDEDADAPPRPCQLRDMPCNYTESPDTRWGTA
ncbi:MAG: hypothetical protein LBC79_05635 [Deltaproteobacteria bacterium]|jgi:hypothetical protein|nr:hypothetical protein [Deltaproteobacteria bacterium]